MQETPISSSPVITVNGKGEITPYDLFISRAITEATFDWLVEAGCGWGDLGTLPREAAQDLFRKVRGAYPFPTRRGRWYRAWLRALKTFRRQIGLPPRTRKRPLRGLFAGQ